MKVLAQPARTVAAYVKNLKPLFVSGLPASNLPKETIIRSKMYIIRAFTKCLLQQKIIETKLVSSDMGVIK